MPRRRVPYPRATGRERHLSVGAGDCRPALAAPRNAATSAGNAPRYRAAARNGALDRLALFITVIIIVPSIAAIEEQHLISAHVGA